MKKTKDKFTEIKIRMVMKLKRLDYQAAIEEIARIDAVRRKTKEEETAAAEDEEEACPNLVTRRRHDLLSLI